MSKYLLRLDDACEYLNISNWRLVEELIEKYDIKPIVGIIPFCNDPDITKFNVFGDFWEMANNWQKKHWSIALHGFNHVFKTQLGGVNPINNRSEFAGIGLETQTKMLKEGVMGLEKRGLKPTIFFAPAHTFDNNTIEALKQATDIRIISDTISSNYYYVDDILFIPQQIGKPRHVALSLVTICIHPNNMTLEEIKHLDAFLLKNHNKFISVSDVQQRKRRKKGFYDRLIKKGYFCLKKIKRRINNA